MTKGRPLCRSRGRSAPQPARCALFGGWGNLVFTIVFAVLLVFMTARAVAGSLVGGAPRMEIGEQCAEEAAGDGGRGFIRHAASLRLNLL